MYVLFGKHITDDKDFFLNIFVLRLITTPILHWNHIIAPSVQSFNKPKTLNYEGTNEKKMTYAIQREDKIQHSGHPFLFYSFVSPLLCCQLMES